MCKIDEQRAKGKDEPTASYEDSVKVTLVSQGKDGEKKAERRKMQNPLIFTSLRLIGLGNTLLY